MMKPLFKPLLLAAALPLAAMAQPVAVQFSTLGFTGQAAARAITITPSGDTLLQTDGTNVITGSPLVLPASPAVVTTNLWPGKYSVTLQGISKSWPLTVTTNLGLGPVAAVRFTTNLVTYIGTTPLTLGGQFAGNINWQTNHQWLAQAAATGAYQMLTTRYNSFMVPTNALVLWPDGTYGVWTATNINSTWLTVDGYTITYTNTGETIAQPSVMRDPWGNVTNSPALVIAP